MIQLNELYYNCPECPSPIEIILIDEKEFQIEINCIDNNHRLKKQIKEYINKMKDFNNKSLNDDVCNYNNHNTKYESYCFLCKKHLCKECLKSRDHISHNKCCLVEIQPNKKELNIIENIIQYYENKIGNL